MYTYILVHVMLGLSETIMAEIIVNGQHDPMFRITFPSKDIKYTVFDNIIELIYLSTKLKY